MQLWGLGPGGGGTIQGRVAGGCGPAGRPGKHSGKRKMNPSPTPVTTQAYRTLTRLPEPAREKAWGAHKNPTVLDVGSWKPLQARAPSVLLAQRPAFLGVGGELGPLSKKRWMPQSSSVCAWSPTEGTLGLCFKIGPVAVNYSHFLS